MITKILPRYNQTFTAETQEELDKLVIDFLNKKNGVKEEPKKKAKNGQTLTETEKSVKKISK
jgi:hypothetical protein